MEYPKMKYTSLVTVSLTVTHSDPEGKDIGVSDLLEAIQSDPDLKIEPEFTEEYPDE